MSEILPYLIGQSVGGSGAVSSVFGRTGAVSAQVGDYSTTNVSNTSSVTGATATAAFDKLKTDLAAVGAGISDWKQSVKTRTNTPAVGPTTGDRYLVGDTPTGTWVGHANAIAQWDGAAWQYTAPTGGDAVNTEDTGHAWVYSGQSSAWNDMGATTVAPVLSVFGRTGAITAQPGDFTATQVTLTPTGNVSATTVQAGIAELDTEKQPVDATLTALASVTTAANQVIYATGADAFATTALTAAGRALIDDADAAAMRTTLGVPQATTQIATQYSLYGGGDLTATRTLSLVNDASTPGANKVYGTDAAGTRGWQNAGGAGAATTGGSGTLATTITTTDITQTGNSLKANGVDLEAGVFDADGSKVTIQYEGTVSNNSAANRTFSFQVRIGGTYGTAAIVQINAANTITTANVGTRSSPLTRSLSITLELWRVTSSTMTGGFSYVIENGTGVIQGQGSLATVSGVNFASALVVDTRAAVSATGTSVAVNGLAWSADRVGTTSGTGASQRVVANISALRAIDPTGSPALTNGELCYLEGYTGPADGGHGYWVWSATSTGTDNSGTIVTPASAPAQGRWLRLHDVGELNVAWFGVSLDGFLRDVEIAKADAALPSSGGTLFFPGGTANVGTWTPSARVRKIIGAGEGSVIQGAVTIYQHAIPREITHVRFSNGLTVQGQEVTLRKCTFDDTLVVTGAAYHLHVADCIIWQSAENKYAITIDNVANAVRFTNTSVFYQARRAASGWATATKAAGIYAGQLENLVIQNCDVSGPGGLGTPISDLAPAIYVDELALGVHISNCYFEPGSGNDYDAYTSDGRPTKTQLVLAGSRCTYIPPGAPVALGNIWNLSDSNRIVLDYPYERNSTSLYAGMHVIDANLLDGTLPLLSRYWGTTIRLVNNTSTASKYINTQGSDQLIGAPYTNGFKINAYSTYDLYADKTAGKWRVLGTWGNYAYDLPTRVPAGGTTNQVLAKASDADCDVTWATVSGSGNVDLGTNTTLTKASHQGKLLNCTAAISLTVDNSTDFDAWGECQIYAGGGVVTVVATATVRRAGSDPLTIPQYGRAVLMRNSTADDYVLSGKLA